jgi:hypothetical protein
MTNALRAGLVLALATWTSSAHAQLASDPSSASSPRVPVSAFARPDPYFSPSRMQITSEISFGTSFNGGPAQGLQVTRLSYQLADPLAVRVSIGNTFGSNFGGPSNHKSASPFLEGLDLSYRPFNSMLIQVHYQDIRSPLQYGQGGYGYWR